jgi:UDP-glucose 4-epimerase
MKILVTGGAGFIGSHIVDALVPHHTVHVLDDLSSGRVENVPSGATLHILDIRAPQVDALFARERFEVLIHHAAQLDVRKSVADPAVDAEINVIGFLNLMEAGRRHGLQKVVFASTGGAIYGEPEYAGQDEAHPTRPISPYGIAKLAAEKYLHYYETQYGIQHVSLRYANVYGPRQSLTGEAGVVAIFIQRILAGTVPIIYGDGTQTRDYTYVGDVVRANRAALDFPGSGVFNVGTDTETTVNDLFTLIRDRLAPGLEPTYGPSRPGEQMRSVLSYQKAARELGWTPQVNLEAGIAETVAWFQAHVSSPIST